MVNFIIGFIAAWILFGIVMLIGEEVTGDIAIFDGFTTYFLLLPLVPLSLLIKLIRTIKEK